MVPRHSYSRTFLVSAWLFSNYVASAPIPMVTHPEGETNIWVTKHNTLNATRPLEGRSLRARQWPGAFGPPGDSSWGPPNGNSFGPPGGNPFGPPGDNPWTTENTLPPTQWTTFTEPPPSTPSTSTTAIPPPPPQTTSQPSTPPVASSPPSPSSTSVLSTPPTSSPPSTSTTSPSTSPPGTTSTPPPPPPPPAPTTSAPPPSAPTTISTPASSPASSPTSTPTSTVPTSGTPASPPAPPATSSPPSPTSSPTSAAPTSSVPPPATSSPAPAPSNSPPPTPSGSPPPSGGNTLQISLVNNLGSSNVNAYVTGLDSSGQVVMLTTSGSYYYLSSPDTDKPQKITADVALPLNGPGQTTTLTLPDYISSARVWFADGTLAFYAVNTQYGPGLVEPTTMNPSDPSADTNWGFVELTFKSGYGLFANLSFVDFVGLPLGIQLQSASSGIQSAMGLPADAASQVCDLLKGQAAQDGQPWDQLCMNDANGNLLRVVAPPTLLSQDANAFNNYWTKYVDEIWQLYTGEPLMIDTQSSAGQVACTSDGTTITCAGDSSTYSKPGAEDIFGCSSGTFAIQESDNDVHLAVVPRLCAAFNRATLHMKGGNVQPSLPPSSYYKSHPNNWYSAFVHKIEAEGKGYAFSYDDVSPTEQDNTSGSVYAPDPQVLTVFIGGASS